MAKTRSLSALVVLAILPLFFSLGFDLDRGELKCEQAASHLADCCPGLELARTSCIQAGGCTREEESTLFAEEETECVRALSCDEIRASKVCTRILERQSALSDPEGPSIAALYEEDWLCD